MPGKLKVLIISERFYPEEFIINELAAELAAGGMQVDVLTQTPSYPFGKIFPDYSNLPLTVEIWKNINITRFFTITGYRNSLFFKLLSYLNFAVTGSFAILFKARGYDRIFVYQPGPLTLALPAVLARKLYGMPVTIWTQDIWPDMVYAYGFKKTKLLVWCLDQFIGFVYRNCDNIMVSCEGFAGRIAEYVPGREIYFFPNWPTVGVQEENEGVKLAHGFNFTFAGNVGKLQNLENVLRGFALASKIQPRLKLNIIGDGSNLETLKSIAQEENIPGVVFWGRRKSDDMPAFFKASDVMVISLNDAPGLNMTVPAKFQAYLAFHKPIFCAMNGAVRALVEKYGNGLCADPSDIDSIKTVFLRFYELRDAGLEKFSQNSKELLDGVYNKTKIINSISKVLAAGKE